MPQPVKRKPPGKRGLYNSPYDSKPPRYTGPTWIGKPITPPPIEAGPEWIGKRIPFRSMAKKPT